MLEHTPHLCLNDEGPRGYLMPQDSKKKVYLCSPDGNGKPIELKGRRRAKCVAFSPTADRVMTGSDDGMGRIWTTRDMGEPLVLELSTLGAPTVNDIAFTPSGDRIMAWISDFTEHEVYEARVTWSALHEYISNATSACLSVADRRQYLNESLEKARENYIACEAAKGRLAPVFGDLNEP